MSKKITIERRTVGSHNDSIPNDEIPSDDIFDDAPHGDGYEDDSEDNAQDSEFHPLIASYASHNGISHNDMLRHLYVTQTYVPDSPSNLPDIVKFEETLMRHIFKNKIVIFGDYDVDGMTSSAILYLFLVRAGHPRHLLEVMLPNRNDGYGMNMHYVKVIANIKPALVISVDNGSTAYEAAHYLASNGIDYLVVDHHQIGVLDSEAIENDVTQIELKEGHYVLSGSDKLPVAQAVVNPMRSDNEYANPYLSGSGVTYRVVEHMADRLNAPSNSLKWLDYYAALGIAADVMPLNFENRYYIRRMMDYKFLDIPSSIMALDREMDYPVYDGIDSTLNSYHDIGFSIAPPFNAVGRIADPHVGFLLLMSDNYKDQKNLARYLIDTNLRRKQYQADITRSVTEKVMSGDFRKISLNEMPREGDIVKRAFDCGVLFVYANVPKGLHGLVASSLAKDTKKVVFVFSKKEGTAIVGGSMRSPKMNMSAIDILHSAKDKWLTYGGHSSVAGFTFYEDNYEAIMLSIIEMMEALPESPFMMPSSDVNSIDGIPVHYWSTPYEMRNINDNILPRLEPMGGNGFPLVNIGINSLPLEVTSSKNGHTFCNAFYNGKKYGLTAYFKTFQSGLYDVVINGSIGDSGYNNKIGNIVGIRDAS